MMGFANFIRRMERFIQLLEWDQEGFFESSLKVSSNFFAFQTYLFTLAIVLGNIYRLMA